MRKSIVAILSASLVLGAFALPQAEAGKKTRKARKVTLSYEMPAFGAAGAGFCAGGMGCPEFALATGEKFVELEIKDATGLPPFASASQDLDGDNLGDVGFDFCGKTDGPQPIEPGVPLLVFVWHGPGANPPCSGTATTGDVTATFTTAPGKK